jgi:hypothetical protein
MTPEGNVEYFNFGTVRQLVASLPALLSQGYILDLSRTDTGCWYGGGARIVLIKPPEENQEADDNGQ